MKDHVLVLGALGSSALGTALAIVADLGLAGGQGLFTASAIGAVAGSSLGWHLLKQQRLIGEKDVEKEYLRTR
jgi:outer membrane lipoprotein SlyB